MAVTSETVSTRLRLTDGDKKLLQSFAVNPSCTANQLASFAEGVSGLRTSPVGFTYKHSERKLINE